MLHSWQERAGDGSSERNKKVERRRVLVYVERDGVVSVGEMQQRCCRIGCYVYLAGNGVGRSAAEVGRFRSAQEPDPGTNTAGGQQREWDVSSLSAPNTQRVLGEQEKWAVGWAGRRRAEGNDANRQTKKKS